MLLVELRRNLVNHLKRILVDLIEKLVELRAKTLNQLTLGK